MMKTPRALIPLSVVFSACTTGGRAVHVGGPPRYYKQNLSWHSDDPRDLCVNFGTLPGDVEPDTRLEDGSGCSKQRIQTDGIIIDQWYGRVGNNVYQIAHAIFAAKLARKTKVNVPLEWTSLDGSIRELFYFSDHFLIDEDEEFRTRVHCSERQGAHFYLYDCEGVVRSDYTKVLRTYLLPYLNDDARAVCKREQANTDRELVVHLRSGDLLDDSTRKGRMAPCSFIEKVMEDPFVCPFFPRLRFITEPDRKHPCLNYFAKTNYKVEVQSKSIAADACAIMYAKHLAYAAKSTFSMALNLFNPEPVAIYNPIGGCRNRKRHNVSCPHGHDVMYCIPGMDYARDTDSKIDFVTNFPSEKLWRVGVGCLK